MEVATPAGAAGAPWAGVYPRSRALPEPRRKTHLQRKALTEQPGFYLFPTRSARWAQKQGRRTYLAVLRGRPRGAAAGEGPPQATPRPAGRPRVRPSLPDEAPRGANSVGNARSFLSGRSVHLPAPRPSPPLRARERRASPWPADSERGSDAEERGFPAWAAVSLQVRARERPSRPGIPPSHVPAELRRRTRSPRGRLGGYRRLGPGRSPGAGGELGGGAGRLPAPRGHRPPGAPGPAPAPPLAEVPPLNSPRHPLPALNPVHPPPTPRPKVPAGPRRSLGCRSPPSLRPAPPSPHLPGRPRPAQSPPAAAALFVWAAGAGQWSCAETRAVRASANGRAGRAARGGAEPGDAAIPPCFCKTHGAGCALQ